MRGVARCEERWCVPRRGLREMKSACRFEKSWPWPPWRPGAMATSRRVHASAAPPPHNRAHRHHRRRHRHRGRRRRQPNTTLPPRCGSSPLRRWRCEIDIESTAHQPALPQLLAARTLGCCRRRRRRRRCGRSPPSLVGGASPPNATSRGSFDLSCSPTDMVHNFRPTTHPPTDRPTYLSHHARRRISDAGADHQARGPHEEAVLRGRHWYCYTIMDVSSAISRSFLVSVCLFTRVWRLWRCGGSGGLVRRGGQKLSRRWPVASYYTSMWTRTRPTAFGLGPNRRSSYLGRPDGCKRGLNVACERARAHFRARHLTMSVASGGGGAAGIARRVDVHSAFRSGS